MSIAIKCSWNSLINSSHDIEYKIIFFDSEIEVICVNKICQRVNIWAL